MDTAKLNISEENYNNSITEFKHCVHGYSVLKYVPLGICIFDKNYEVIFWNKCLTNWSGVASSDIVGKNIIESFPTLNSPGFTERLDYVFKGGPPVLFSSQLHRNTIPCKLSDGSYMIQKSVISSMPSPVKEGDFFALMAIENATELSRKVSEYRMLRNQAMEEVKLRKKIEADLIESHLALLEHQEVTMQKERLKVLLEMAGATAHELNQPLMTLLGTIELMNMTQEVSEETLKYLANIEKSAKRIADIVSKIQTIRQYQTKKYLDNVSIIDLNESSSL
ncbi:MAG: histidine kinase dimerization/phospho-acceptor domain-containing protein [Desulfamplus sp.]